VTTARAGCSIGNGTSSPDEAGLGPERSDVPWEVRCGLVVMRVLSCVVFFHEVVRGHEHRRNELVQGHRELVRLAHTDRMSEIPAFARTELLP
jgi:hypothetical protein